MKKYLYVFNYPPEDKELCALEFRALFKDKFKSKYYLSNLNYSVDKSVFMKAKIDIWQINDDFNQLIKQIKNTKNIYIIGVHYSSLPAKHLVLGLQDLGINTYFAYDYMQASHLYNTIHEDDLLIYFSIEGNQNNVSRFFDLTNASKNTYMITLNPKPKLLIENTLILPGYTLSKQSIVDLQSIVVIFVELLLNMFHNTLKED